MASEHRLPGFLTRRVANGTGFLVCCALMAYALYAQYALLLEPCPLCTFQRIAVVLLGAVFLLAMLHNPQQRGVRAYALVLAIVALAGIGTSAKHIWVQAQPPGSVASCGPSLGYLFDIMPVIDVIKKVFMGSGECQKIDWTLLGLSMPWWTAFAVTALGIWAVTTNWILKR